MKIFELLKSPLFDNHGDRPRIIAGWLLDNGLLSDQKDLKFEQAAVFFYSLATAKQAEDINTPDESICRFLEMRIMYHKLSGYDIFDLKTVRISQTRLEFVYKNGDVNWIGAEQHSGEPERISGSWFIEYRRLTTLF